ncbi:MAG TPA: MFS transporter, partial [Polyangiales bacterium]
PNNRNMFLQAPPARSAAAGGIQSTARLTGQTVGGVLMTLLFTSTSADLSPRLGLGIAALFASFAAVVSARRASR